MLNSCSKKFIKTLLVLLAFIIPLSGFSWGITGHRVVAEIAQNHLTKRAKKELKKLLGKETLAEWANWPDFIKSDTTNTWKHTSQWHYVNMPGGLNKEDYINTLKNLQGENLYTEITTLKNQIANSSLTIEQRKTALIFLIHLIGDLHQPLHVGREEDLGGNKIKVTWFDEPSNIHKVWDESLVDYQQYSYTEYAAILNKASKEQIKYWQNTSLENWFYESYEIANKIYAQTPAGSKLKYRYNYIFVDDLNNQLLKGGLRLAKILNEVFD
ncbi:MAG: S1/P1 nuclease [Chitinophagaceae bacterium]|nr:S1/P1 nuclease [Chitinophagaceae bacterium]MCW5904214.1 S1/P1 nuclease [Chitinophagaceae bacterium]